MFIPDASGLTSEESGSAEEMSRAAVTTSHKTNEMNVMAGSGASKTGGTFHCTKFTRKGR